MDADRTKIAAVGDFASVLLFNALGITAVGADTPQDAERELTRLISEGYSVIYVTEKTARGVPEIIERYKSRTFPAIIPIPDKDGSDGSGLRAIQANMEKAVGKNIF